VGISRGSVHVRVWRATITSTNSINHGLWRKAIAATRIQGCWRKTLAISAEEVICTITNALSDDSAGEDIDIRVTRTTVKKTLSIAHDVRVIATTYSLVIVGIRIVASTNTLIVLVRG
jgi:hypothetical protein